MGVPFQVAEDHRRPITLWEPVDLLVEQPLQLGGGLGEPRRLRPGRAPFVPSPTRGRGTGTRSRAIGHLMQPGAQRIPHPEGASLADQDQERRLECVLGVVRVGQDAPADALHHRPVPLDQDREGELGGVIPIGREPFQELAVGQTRGPYPR